MSQQAFAKADLHEVTSGREQAFDILLALARSTGEDFLSQLPQMLASTLSVSGAYICELAFDREHAYSVVAAFDEAAQDGQRDFATGGVFEALIEKGELAHGHSLGRLYPEDELVESLKADALIGLVLRSDSSDPLGVLFVVNRAPLLSVDLIKTVLDLIAPRVAGELQRRQKDIALNRSESRLRFLAEHSKDMLFYQQLLPVSAVQWVSPAAEDIFGYPPEAFHANPDLVLQLVEMEDRHHFASSILSGSEEPFVARIRRPDGSHRWVEYRDFPVYDSQDRLAGIGGTVRDVTRRVEFEQAVRASEEYVRALLGAMPETLLRVTSDGAILDYVPGEVAVGQGDRSQVIGRNYKELLSLALIGVLDRMIRAAVRSGRPQQIEMELPGDQHRVYEARCLPFGDGEVLVVLRDFTAKRWHEGEEERQRIRDEIDYRIEHKTRSNPYALTYREIAVLHLVVEGMADKQIADALGISIYTVNKHVGNILGKMNAVSRTEAGVRAVKEGLLGAGQD